MNYYDKWLLGFLVLVSLLILTMASILEIKLSKRARIKALEEPLLYVALLLPMFDGSGYTQILGVFNSESGAWAAIGRKIKGQGYDQPTSVTAVQMNHLYHITED